MDRKINHMMGHPKLKEYLYLMKALILKFQSYDQERVEVYELQHR